MTVAFAAVGACTALGTTYEATRTAYLAGRRGIVQDDEILGADGLPQSMACAFPFHRETDHIGRLTLLLRHAIDDCLGRSPAGEAPEAEPLPLYLTVQPWLEPHDQLTRQLEDMRRGLARGPSRIEVSYGGQAESLAALFERARTATSPCLVGAVDSYIHPDIWLSLGVTGRVLTRDNPHGCIPGEAACVLLCVPSPEAALLGRPLAFHEASEMEDVDRRTGLIGRGLRSCFDPMLAETEPSLLFSDLDGERWRAEEFGFAAAAADSAHADLFAHPQCPALQFGNTGAASGPLYVALALAARHPPSSARTIAAISASTRSTGRRCVALVEKAIP